MKLIIVFILLTSCAKDLDFNPYTTIIKQLIKNENSHTVPDNNSKHNMFDTRPHLGLPNWFRNKK